VLSASAHLFACAVAIAEFASDDLKRKLLPDLFAGRLVGANAMTEAESGSDSTALRARARRDGDDYVLDGAKLFVTNGPIADVVVVYASTNPSHGYLGVSAFVVETSRSGVKVGPPVDEPLPSSPLGALYLEECRIPASHRLGAEGVGGAVFQRSMLWERSCLFAGYLGTMQGQLDRAVEFARTRRQFGRPIARNQAISHRIADMKQRLEAARLLLYRACWMLGRGETPTMEVALAKLAISEGAVQSSLDAMHIQGGGGVTSPAESLHLAAAVAARIFSGTSEIQRDLIARGLGL
jgi:alkylation response protein AidB-like acyl-CoA dehydrogenase